MTEIPQVRLNDGHTIPAIGFGTYPLRGTSGVEAIVSALRTGYRLIDSAVNYENEGAVGEALRRSGVPREQVRVVTKIPGRFHAHDLAVDSVHESLWRTGLDYFDLVLIHWPNPSVDLYTEAWQALVDVQRAGLAASIGVSNFTGAQLDRIVRASGVVPAVNQIEVHPLFPQVQQLAINAELGIITEAWSPLGKGKAQFEASPVRQAAEVHQVSPAQVILRWHIERGVVPLPKSSDPARQAANLDVFGFSLTPDEVDAITALGRPDGRLFDGDPDTHEEQ